MRCDRCGRNEATFYYKSNINGKVTQIHLCPQCAECPLPLLKEMGPPATKRNNFAAGGKNAPPSFTNYLQTWSKKVKNSC